jgi:catechol 2,3-dioxygenase-like lactoylglutathione lyase family enzyme
MTDFRFVLLYVADVPRSTAFYADLLGRPAIDASPGFAMFEAAPGVRLGLWRAEEVEPKTSGRPGGGELCIVAPKAEITPTAAAWEEKGIEIVQAPTQTDFGFTFVGLDPDGHRLRVFAPAG